MILYFPLIVWLSVGAVAFAVSAAVRDSIFIMRNEIKN